jgi:hypothetical protein
VSEHAGRPQRSAAGLVGAMLVLLLLVVGAVVLRDLDRTEPEQPVAPVEWRQSVAFARAQAEFELLAPRSLPTGWRATSVEFSQDPPRWHLGLLTRRDRYVGLEQTGDLARSAVETYVDEAATREESLLIGGQRWAQWTDSGGDRALVRRQDGLTTLVVGPVPRPVLVDFVGLLR